MKNKLRYSFFLFLLACGRMYADPGIRIYTHIDDTMIGKPSWVIVLRDRDTGITEPYLFDFRKGDNFWIALSPAKQYEVTISNLRFHPFPAEFKNFCGLEKKKLNNQSISLELTGKLTPQRHTLKCKWMQYRN